MSDLNEILQSDPATLLNTLEPFQKEIIEIFLAQNGNDYLDSADRWLNATAKDTFKFGGTHGKTKIYLDKLLSELEKFLCGDKDYEADREKIKASGDNTEKYTIGVLSSAIGSYLGVAGTFIAPIIVLLLISIGKMSINAWCAMRKEDREKREREEKENAEKEEA